MCVCARARVCDPTNNPNKTLLPHTQTTPQNKNTPSFSAPLYTLYPQETRRMKRKGGGRAKRRRRKAAAAANRGGNGKPERAGEVEAKNPSFHQVL